METRQAPPRAARSRRRARPSDRATRTGGKSHECRRWIVSKSGEEEDEEMGIRMRFNEARGDRVSNAEASAYANDPNAKLSLPTPTGLEITAASSATAGIAAGLTNAADGSPSIQMGATPAATALSAPREPDRGDQAHRE